jgi:hypothetical protein
MTGLSAVQTLQAFGCDARSDGLGHVQARVWNHHPDGTQTSQWAAVPTDGPALMRWLHESGVA